MMLLWWGWVLGLMIALVGYCHQHIYKAWKDILAISILAWLRMIAFPVQRHVFEGHEAEYIQYFLGDSFPNPGDTTSYPAMQIWWYLWGSIFAPHQMAPLWIASFIGMGSLFLLWRGVGALFSSSSWLTFLWLMTIPLHWVWSLSAYNIIFPFFFVSLGFWLLVQHKSHWSVAAALALGVSMRLELFYVCVPILYWAWFERKQHWSLIAVLLLPVLSVTGMMTAVIPGEGERGLSFSVNWSLVQFHSPYHWLFPLLLYGWFLGQKREMIHWMNGALLLVIGNHLLMATFDDYASRHTLVSVVGFCVLLAPIVAHKKARVVLAGVLLVHVIELRNIRERWYAEPEVFLEAIRKEYPSLSVKTVAEARSEQCAWVAEEEAFAGEPVLSHFNLLDPTEVQELFMEHSCIDWCLGFQDWRWSSLGVYDRAVRIRTMYDVEEKSIVQSEEQFCLQFKIGKR